MSHWSFRGKKCFSFQKIRKEMTCFQGSKKSQTELFHRFITHHGWFPLSSGRVTVGVSIHDNCTTRTRATARTVREGAMFWRQECPCPSHATSSSLPSLSPLHWTLACRAGGARSSGRCILTQHHAVAGDQPAFRPCRRISAPASASSRE